MKTKKVMRKGGKTGDPITRINKRVAKNEAKKELDKVKEKTKKELEKISVREKEVEVKAEHLEKLIDEGL
jgi:hypothetical protein